MIFVNMYLFYAIIISYMSDARQSQEMAQAKEMGKFTDKINGFLESVSRILQLQARFRGTFPGLYSRMKNWEKNRMALEKKRDERLVERARMLAPHEDSEDQLGSANPNCGRRKMRVFKQEVDWEADDDAKSEEESEPDLGPLRFKEQLEDKPGHDDHYDDHHHGHHEHRHGSHETAGHHDDHGHESGFDHPSNDLIHQMLPGHFIPGEDEIDRGEEAKELVLEATEHVVATIKDRCKGARALVKGEMDEARQVLQGIGNVLEVLGRRARSLEAQQEQILPPEVVARVKQQAADEEEESSQF